MDVRRPTRACALLILAACGAPQEATREQARGVEPAPAPRPAELAHLDGAAWERALRLSPLPAQPADPTNRWADDPAAAHLGQFVFFDERFSGAGDVSCSTCHQPELGWSDGRPFGIGVAQVDRHSMPLFNVGHNRWFFWDGRADSLWAQALLPLEDSREHGGSRLQYAHLVASDTELRNAYEQVFGPLPDLSDPERFPPAGRPVPEDAAHPHQAAWAAMHADDRAAVTEVFVNIGKALAAFERRLVSEPSPFDEFVAGWRAGDASKMAALDAPARRGLALFVGDANCHLCHHGPNFTDFEFHNTRVPPHAQGEMYDPGRFEGVLLVQALPFRGTERWSDDPAAAAVKLDYLTQTGHNWGEFKTPSLRDVATSAPYMHQGQFATLHDVVRHYSTLEGALPLHQHSETILQPLNLSEGEIDDLVAFLRSLTGADQDPTLKVRPASPRLGGE